MTSSRPGATATASLPRLRLPGGVNTAANEFDATFLRDGATIVFARAMDFRTDRVDLFQATPRRGRYGAATILPDSVNSRFDTYGPMLDWSDMDRLAFSSRRDGASSMDLYRIRYRLGEAGD